MVIKIPTVCFWAKFHKTSSRFRVRKQLLTDHSKPHRRREGKQSNKQKPQDTVIYWFWGQISTQCYMLWMVFRQTWPESGLRFWWEKPFSCHISLISACECCDQMGKVIKEKPLVGCSIQDLALSFFCIIDNDALSKFPAIKMSTLMSCCQAGFSSGDATHKQERFPSIVLRLMCGFLSYLPWIAGIG